MNELRHELAQESSSAPRQDTRGVMQQERWWLAVWTAVPRAGRRTVRLRLWRRWRPDLPGLQTGVRCRVRTWPAANARMREGLLVLRAAGRRRPSPVAVPLCPTRQSGRGRGRTPQDSTAFLRDARRPGTPRSADADRSRRSFSRRDQHHVRPSGFRWCNSFDTLPLRLYKQRVSTGRDLHTVVSYVSS